MTRIVKLPKHDNVLIGRDLAGIFENGHVYSVKKFLGEIVITDLGVSALPKENNYWPNVNSTIEEIMCSTSPCMVYFTQKEAEDYYLKEGE